jgi:predicted nucleic acid-binding protein
LGRFIDTIVLVGTINPKDESHSVAQAHMQSISSDPETFLPFSSALEFDLVLKARGYTDDERANALEWLVSSVPPGKVACNSLSSLTEAARLQKDGMSYFDSLIAALALGSDGVVVTKDREISGVVKTEW